MMQLHSFQRLSKRNFTLFEKIVSVHDTPLQHSWIFKTQLKNTLFLKHQLITEYKD